MCVQRGCVRVCMYVCLLILWASDYLWCSAAANIYSRSVIFAQLVLTHINTNWQQNLCLLFHAVFRIKLGHYFWRFTSIFSILNCIHSQVLQPQVLLHQWFPSLRWPTALSPPPAQSFASPFFARILHSCAASKSCHLYVRCSSVWILMFCLRVRSRWWSFWVTHRTSTEGS